MANRQTGRITEDNRIVVSQVRWAVAIDGGQYFAHGGKTAPSATFSTRKEAREYAVECAKGGGHWTARRVRVTIEECKD